MTRAQILVLPLLAILAPAVACKGDDGPAETKDDAPVAAASDGKSADDGKADAAGETGAEAQVVEKPKTKTGGLAGLAVGLVSDAKESSKRPLTLIPASAHLVLHADLTALSKLPPVGPIRDYTLKEATGDSSGADMLARLKGCALDIDLLTSATLASVGDDDAIGVIKGPGFGKPDAYECLADKMRADGKEVKFSIETEGEQKVLAMKEDRAFFLNDDAVLIVDEHQLAAVEAVREDRAPTVADGKLASILAKVDQTKHGWIAMVGPEEPFDSGPMSDALAAWGTMHYDEDLEVVFVIEGKDTSAATTLHDKIEQGIGEMRGMVPMLGLTTSVIDGITVERDDKLVTLTVKLSKSDLESATTAIRGFMR